MTVTEALALLVAGAAAGIISTVVGLASLVSYPALLAIGLPPLTANMTNTAAPTPVNSSATVLVILAVSGGSPIASSAG